MPGTGQFLGRTAVCYLLRGEGEWRASAGRFLESYRCHPAGVPHTFYVILKGFEREADAALGQAMFQDLGRAISVSDEDFDLGAYRSAARLLDEDRICFLNTHSQLLADNWLYKLSVNLDLPNVAMVGATGSFERLGVAEPVGSEFPNPHLRTNGFLMDRQLFLKLAGAAPLASKDDTHVLESGVDGLTAKLRHQGRQVLVVGRNGRGYAPQGWPLSLTFRRLDQPNLMIADNQTRRFQQSLLQERIALVRRAWGPYLDADRSIPVAKALDRALQVARVDEAPQGRPLTDWRRRWGSRRKES